MPVNLYERTKGSYLNHNDLIETLKDGQEGFKQAAQGIKDPQLKSLFNEYSQQRSRFAAELQRQAASLGEPEPERSSSAVGAAHRAWINLKSAVTGGDGHAILAECERGEDSAVEEYKKAIDSNLSVPVRDIVSRQYAEIKRRTTASNIYATPPNRPDRAKTPSRLTIVSFVPAAVARRCRSPTRFSLRPTMSSEAKHFRCLKKKQLNERAKTSVKAKHLLLKRASSYAKRWSTFGKANMALARPSRRSPSGYQRHAEPESSCLHLSGEAGQRANETPSET
jgi:uncharacterized protein (TIGR02284 family)